mmetsp:Transcript_42309/g.122348  ORF Transcript_42309/g.122348 Transcript_42309/m.122348 type:complete len:796 (-) Transcript_42309:705-3092(-)
MRAATDLRFDQDSTAGRPWRHDMHRVPINLVALLIPRRHEQPVAQDLCQDVRLLGQLGRGAMLLDGDDHRVLGGHEGMVRDGRDDILKEHLRGHGVPVLHDRLAAQPVPDIDLHRSATCTQDLDVAEDGGAAAELVSLEVRVVRCLDEVGRQRPGHVLEDPPLRRVDQGVAGRAQQLREARSGKRAAGLHERRGEKTKEPLHLTCGRPQAQSLHVGEKRRESLGVDRIAALEAAGPRHRGVDGLHVQGLHVAQHPPEVGQVHNTITASFGAWATGASRQRLGPLEGIDVQIAPQGLHVRRAQAGAALRLRKGEHPLDAPPLPHALALGAQEVRIRQANASRPGRRQSAPQLAWLHPSLQQAEGASARSRSLQISVATSRIDAAAVGPQHPRLGHRRGRRNLIDAGLGVGGGHLQSCHPELRLAGGRSREAERHAADLDDESPELAPVGLRPFRGEIALREANPGDVDPLDLVARHSRCFPLFVEGAFGHRLEDQRVAVHVQERLNVLLPAPPPSYEGLLHQLKSPAVADREVEGLVDGNVLAKGPGARVGAEERPRRLARRQHGRRNRATLHTGLYAVDKPLDAILGLAERLHLSHEHGLEAPGVVLRRNRVNLLKEAEAARLQHMRRGLSEVEALQHIDNADVEDDAFGRLVSHERALELGLEAGERAQWGTHRLRGIGDLQRFPAKAVVHAQADRVVHDVMVAQESSVLAQRLHELVPQPGVGNAKGLVGEVQVLEDFADFRIHPSILGRPLQVVNHMGLHVCLAMQHVVHHCQQDPTTSAIKLEDPEEAAEQ